MDQAAGDDNLAVPRLAERISLDVVDQVVDQAAGHNNLLAERISHQVVDQVAGDNNLAELQLAEQRSLVVENCQRSNQQPMSTQIGFEWGQRTGAGIGTADTRVIDATSARIREAIVKCIRSKYIQDSINEWEGG